MAPTVNEKTSTDSTQCYPVTFNDKGNKKPVTYNIPIGWNINTTNDSYTVKADGIYKNGVKVDNIEVMLANRIALDVFDKNNDTNIDTKDIEIFKDPKQSAAKEIDDKLKRHGSDYYCYVVETSEGGYEEAGVSEEGFYATFTKDNNTDKKIKKEFSITPPQQEKEGTWLDKLKKWWND